MLGFRCFRGLVVFGVVVFSGVFFFFFSGGSSVYVF